MGKSARKLKILTKKQIDKIFIDSAESLKNEIVIEMTSIYNLLSDHGNISTLSDVDATKLIFDRIIREVNSKLERLIINETKKTKRKTTGN